MGEHGSTKNKFSPRIQRGKGTAKTHLKNPQEVRSQILSQIELLEKNVNNQIQATQKNTRRKLIRNSVKWNLGALVCAVAFIWIWYSTKWCRIRR